MQYELIRLKNELGITFIYVTHDQEEALTMSDTIVVMNQGYIQQIGTPEHIYNEPENAFVADFIGESNIIPSLMLKDQSGKDTWVPVLPAWTKALDKTNRWMSSSVRKISALVKPGEGSI